MTDAVAQGLSVSKAERLRRILSRRLNAFRRALRGDPPARVDPMRVQLKPGASTFQQLLSHFLYSEVRLPHSIIFMFKRFSFLSP